MYQLEYSCIQNKAIKVVKLIQMSKISMKLNIIVPRLKTMIFETECPQKINITKILSHILNAIFPGIAITNKLQIFVDEKMSEKVSGEESVMDGGCYYVEMGKDKYDGLVEEMSKQLGNGVEPKQQKQQAKERKREQRIENRIVENKQIEIPQTINKVEKGKQQQHQVQQLSQYSPQNSKTLHRNEQKTLHRSEQKTLHRSEQKTLHRSEQKTMELIQIQNPEEQQKNTNNQQNPPTTVPKVTSQSCCQLI